MTSSSEARPAPPDGPRISAELQATDRRWRNTFVRLVGTAHLMAGAIIGSGLVYAYIAPLDDIDEPAVSYLMTPIGLAGAINGSLRTLHWDAEIFAMMSGNPPYYMGQLADDGILKPLVVISCVVFAGVLMAIGVGLRWRRAWARIACLILVGGSALLAAIHQGMLLAC